MIVDERIVTFINSLDTKNSELLEKIESEARAADVPIIRREMQSFLKVLLMLKKPVQILEVGTAVGFSALLMSENRKSAGSQRLKTMKREFPLPGRTSGVRRRKTRSRCSRVTRQKC